MSSPTRPRWPSTSPWRWTPATSSAPCGRRHAWRHRRLARPLHELEGLHTQNEGRVFPPSGPIGHAHFVEALSDAAPEHTSSPPAAPASRWSSSTRASATSRASAASSPPASGDGLQAAGGHRRLPRQRPPAHAGRGIDGSLQLNLQELATLAGLQLPICLFIMNNGGYASIRNTQRNYFNGRYVGSGPASGLTMPDLEARCRVWPALHAHRRLRASLADALARAQQRCRALPDRRATGARRDPAAKCAAIPRADGSIVSMPLEDMSPCCPSNPQGRDDRAATACFTRGSATARGREA